VRAPAVTVTAGSWSPGLPPARFPVLADAVVRLRRITAADVPSILAISAYDGVAATDEAEALDMLRRIDTDQARGDCLHWGICLTGSEGVVGTCGYYRGFDLGVGELGYVLQESHRGCGLMTRALGLVIAYGLRELRLRGVVAYTAAGNHASQAVLARLGFRRVPTRGSGLAFRYP
jgi:[ribosomal protein S5]-alanine N-acetyltransferase